MNYLLDTCVLSEYTRRRPDGKVIQWMDAIRDDELYISVITFGEIQRGIDKLTESPRRTDLITWMNEDLVNRFDGRIVPIDLETMLLWGNLTARMDANGTPMSLMDSLIAVSALRNNLVLVTRNETDFQASGVRLVNPWK
jgi:toxin FitB